jgi:hypothetical protein
MSKRLYLTELSTFATCPYSWWMRYVEAPQAFKDNRAMQFGRAVHQIVAATVAGASEDDQRREAFRGNDLLDGPDVCRALVTSRNAEPFLPVKGWPERSWEYDGFGGIVDLWDYSTSTLTDWKTGSWRSPDIKRNMGFYAWGIAESLDLKQVSARLVYLETRRKSEWTFSREELSEVGVWARLTRDRLEEARWDAEARIATKGPFCRLCGLACAA